MLTLQEKADSLDACRAMLDGEPIEFRSSLTGHWMFTKHIEAGRAHRRKPAPPPAPRLVPLGPDDMLGCVLRSELAGAGFVAIKEATYERMTTKTTMSHKEMTSHIRTRVSASGIKARVMMRNYCGVRGIAVVVPAYEIQFTASEQREIRIIAKVNGLTRARGTEIDIERMTDPAQVNFEFHG